MKLVRIGLIGLSCLTSGALAQQRAPEPVPTTIPTVPPRGAVIAAPGRQITIYDRRGTVVKRVGSPGPYNVVSLSPDGKRVAVPESGGIVVYDVATGVKTQMAPGPGSTQPAWSSDGKRIVYQANRNGMTGFYQVVTDGSAKEELLFSPVPQPNLTGLSADGGYITYHGPFQPPKGTGIDLWILPMNGTRAPVSLLSTPRNESGARISPDGKLVAFRSDESGRFEVYVRPFNPAGIADPDNTPKLKLSIEGSGGMVRWRSDGKAVYYLAADGSIMEVEVEPAPVFKVVRSQALFQTPIDFPLTGTPGADCRFRNFKPELLRRTHGWSTRLCT
jgi:Tol biopolymer transport system component